MTGIQEIKAWKTSDGRTFPRRWEAEKHEMTAELEKILAVAGVCRGGDWSQVMIVDFMVENAHAISKCLNIICSPDGGPNRDGPSSI